MTVIRVKHTDQYVVIKKSALEDPKLSFKAKGLWAYCMSRPNDWHFNISHLSTVSKEGEHAIYSAIKELIDAGYAIRIQQNKGKGEGNGRGSFGTTDYIVYEDCQIKNSFTLPDFPDAGNSDPSNQALLSIDPKLSNDLKSPIVPKGDISSRNSKREEKKQRAPEVYTTDTQHKDLLHRCKGNQMILEASYDRLSRWKIGKGITGGKNDYKAITDWVLKSIMKDIENGSSREEENKRLAQKVIESFPIDVANNHIQLQPKGILFCYTGCWDEINYTDNGFKDRILSRLRKMNLNTKGLSND